MAAIVVDDVVKTYTYHLKLPGLRGSISSLIHRQTQERHAINGISFGIDQGEFVGFLGPNGAGKTTTLKILCGPLHPSAGTVRVLGYTPAQRSPGYLRQIALVMGQKSMLWWDLPAMETLLLHKDMYNVSTRMFRRTLDELVGLLEVQHVLHVPVRKLSLGERMKMELLAALIHRPSMLFLDEPTIGLDVVAQQRVRTFLRQINTDSGTTILLPKFRPK